MYTLRRILRDGTEFNFALGKSYSVIRKDSVSTEEWNSLSIRYWGSKFEETIKSEKPEVAERDCSAFVISEHGSDYHFILPWQQNYIKTERGHTFSKLS